MTEAASFAYTPTRPDPSLPPVRINLYSDTQTRPSAAMKEAMMRAEVGDEQNGGDPTVHDLCERMAALLGTEAAVFLPSGTMCNQVAIHVHCRPGDVILAHRHSHIVTSEGGGPWANSGATVQPLDGERGIFAPDTLRAAMRPPSRYAAPQTLVEVEQTSNLGGGAVWPVAQLAEVATIARSAGLATHMDGARLMNAVVASGIAARDMVVGWDSVWLDFTKGLGAPLGAVLCGGRAFIDQAWRWKQRLGGSMRQAGICAAACLYALDNNVARLAEDHDNARRLAANLAQIPGVRVIEPDTNLVYVDVAATGHATAEVIAGLRRDGIMVSGLNGMIRLCTHLDVTAAQIEEASQIIRARLSA